MLRWRREEMWWMTVGRRSFVPNVFEPVGDAAACGVGDPGELYWN